MSDTRIVKMYEKEITQANILRVAAGTTGLCGGDSGHGGRTFIELEDLGDTDIECKVQENASGNLLIKIGLGGDSELETIVEAFEFVAETLGREVKEKTL